ncbi:flagellar biosynthesis protein FlaG [Helicobacter pylori]|uniref:Flagellar biosynthesis protein FlaG n=2 Tax=Helicobacter pylori TaxID=210 RepID=A0A293U2M4_HELPX|nr:FlaG family protein [Helicobacter pylori]EKE85719.1 flaG family protein [Helicobacter pylori R036d]MBH0250098.1 flagellar protein FlaG [Helicobacter pylori]MBH0276876.1 flagellar protein FlaG [Helicobacter pylori]MBH0278187.1 flagellar protein FlaG [Helicobacter pylori]MBH0281491.1 flagellar protein FlaG [Helicobacter pylori]
MVNEVQGIGIPTSHTSVQTTPTKEISRANTINTIENTIDESKTTIDPDQYKPKLELLSERLNEEMKRIGTDINFSYNDTIKGLVVSVKDANGDKVIREIPSKEAVELMQRMRDVIGIIFDKRG